MCILVKLIRKSLARRWGPEQELEVIREELGRIKENDREMFQAESVAQERIRGGYGYQQRLENKCEL